MQLAKEVPNVEDKEVKGAEDGAVGCRVHRKHGHRDRREPGVPDYSTTNVRQTILGSGVLATHQSDSKYLASDGEVEGKAGLDHCDGPSDRIGRRISRLSRNQTSSFTVSGKPLGHRYGDCPFTSHDRPLLIYFLTFRCFHEPFVGPSAEDVESCG